MIVNIETFDNIYELLEINKNLIEYAPAIVKDSKSMRDIFPRVLIQEVNNIITDLTTRREESKCDIYFTIYIYAKDLIDNDTKQIIPKIDVARKIWKDVDIILNTIKIKRMGLAKVVPNLDETIYELGINYYMSLNNRKLFI